MDPAAAIECKHTNIFLVLKQHGTFNAGACDFRCAEGSSGLAQGGRILRRSFVFQESIRDGERGWKGRGQKC